MSATSATAVIGACPPAATALLSERPEAIGPDDVLAEVVVPSSVWFGPVLSDGQEQELLAFLGTHNGVAVLQWPRDARLVATLARVGLPRLLLVHPSPTVVPDDGPLQTALPATAPDDVIHRSLLALCGEARRRRAAAGTPVVTEDGWVRTATGRVELLPDEHRLAEPLLVHFGAPVDDGTLCCSEGLEPSSCAALEGHIARLCRRVNALGLEVVAVPGEAHLMRWSAA